MSRISIVAAFTLTLLACSSIWQDRTELAALSLSIDEVAVEIDVEAQLTADEGVLCEQLEVALSLKWSGDTELAFKVLDSAGEELDSGVVAAGTETATRAQIWTEVDATSCSADFLLVLDAADAPHTGDLGIAVVANDTSSSPEDNPENAVLEASAALVE